MAGRLRTSTDGRGVAVCLQVIAVVFDRKMELIEDSLKNLAMNPTPAQFASYQQVSDYFNRASFESSLPDCMLSFSRRRRNSNTLSAAGHCGGNPAPATAEIGLNMKQLSEKEQKEMIAMLVGEMVHLLQERYVRQLSSKRYFNREWAEKMATIGLPPQQRGNPAAKRQGKG